MIVHLLARPVTDVCRIPRSRLTTIAEGLRSAGVSAVDDARMAEECSVAASVAKCSADLRRRWKDQQPDVVHAMGVIATLAALDARSGHTRVVATFDERPGLPRVERHLAPRVDAVLPLSTREREQWRRAGARTASGGPWRLPVPLRDPDIRPMAAGGDVVTMASGATLDLIVASMPYWSPARLVVIGRPGPNRWAEVRRSADALGVLHRIDRRAGLRGEDRGAMWAAATALVAGTDCARHGGPVLEAAAHGVPAVALATEAYLDHVVPGVTGVLVDPKAGPRTLGAAIASLVRDPLRARGYGASAMLRVRSVHAPDVSGRALSEMYGQVLDVGSVSAPGSSGLTRERSDLALAHLPLARQLAQRYAGRGQSMDDLVQVASLGLIKAAERFDPGMGSEFHSFAVPTILGELRRHFRDHAWAMRVPRSMQETTLDVRRSSEGLVQSLGHEATAADIAEALDLVESDVRRAWQTHGEAMSVWSLDHPLGGDPVSGDKGGTVRDLFGAPDAELDLVEAREAVREALARLPDREREVLVLRFFGEKTQAEIAQRLGVSQVHISRMITKTLATLRDHVVDEAPLPASWAATPSGRDRA